jgi:hypothetical protein
MIQPAYPDLPRPVLATLLDLAGEASAHSPRRFMGSSTSLSQSQIHELTKAHILDQPRFEKSQLSPAFRQVAATLLAPRTHLTVRAWSGEKDCVELEAHFPGAILQGGGVGMNLVGAGYRIHAPLNEQSLLETLAPLLPARGRVMDFSACLPAPTAALLCGFIDQHARRTNPKAAPENGTLRPLTLVSLIGYVLDDWGVTSFEQLLTCVPILARLAEPPSYPLLADAFRALESAGLLLETPEGTLLPGAPLRPLLEGMGKIIGGLQWQQSSLNGTAEGQALEWIVLFGQGNGLLLMRPRPGGRIEFEGLTPERVTRLVLDELTSTEGATLTPPAEPTLAPKPVPLDPALEPLLPTPRAEAKHRFCSACGAALKQDGRFCSSCGHPVGEESVSPQASPSPIPPSSKPPRQHRIAWRLLGAIVALTGGLLFYFRQPFLGWAHRTFKPSTPITWKSMRGQFGVATLTVSSALENANGFSYGPENLYDGDPSTAWVEGIWGSGIGESITFQYEYPMRFRRILITNGYAKSSDLFYKNGRVKELLVEAADGIRYTFTLEDSMQAQSIGLPYAIDTSWIKFTIQSVYPGTVYSDATISEIAIDLESENYQEAR